MQASDNTQPLNINRLLQSWHLLRFHTQSALLALCLILFSHQALAITYNFSDSGVSPALSGCSRTGAGTYTCTSAVTLRGNDSITISGTTPATITFNSNLTLQFINETTWATINAAGSASNLRLVVGGTLSLGKKTVVNANVQAGSVNDTGGNVTFGGSIATTTGAINIGYASTVAGPITSTTGAITSNSDTTLQSITCNCTITGNYAVIYNGNVSGVTVNNSSNYAQFKGSVTATTGGVLLGQFTTVSGAVSSTSGGIVLYGNNTLSSNVTCTSCTMNVYNSSNTVNGSISVNFFDDSSSGSNFQGNITATSTSGKAAFIYIGTSSRVTGNVNAYSSFANNAQVRLRNGASVTGDVGAYASGASSITDAYIYLDSNSTVTGNVTANSTGTNQVTRVEKYSGATVNGSISAISASPTYATVFLHAGTVTGSVTSSDNIYNYANIGGCAQSTFSKTIFLYTSSSAGGVCCGGTNSCNNSCVNTSFFVSMPPTCSFNATKIASYSLDELTWNGTANEVKDTAGFTGGPFDGQGKGTPVPTSNTIAPARVGTTGTCGYATFSGSTNGGSAFTLDGLPVSTALGELTSVSFWMYWDGTNFVQPIGWRQYNLFFSDGNFGFNTGAYDIWGVSSSGLANGWHHVAAVFANGNVANSRLYINGVQRTLVQTRSIDVNNANAYVQSTLDISGWTLDTSWRFTGGRIDEIRVYRGAMTQAQVTADFNETHLCPVYNVVPSNFNCVVVGGDASTGRLYTQVAGSPFSVDIVALKSTGAVETSYVASGTKSVTLEFVDGSGTTACGSRAVLNPAVSQSVSFSLADAGRKTVSNINISRAYRDLVCRVTDANQTPTVVGCSSDDFAVRPASLSVTSSNANADSSGSNATASPAIKAGANFNLTATSGVAGYDGTPLIDSSKLNAHSGAIQLGVLSGGFSAANVATGISLGNAFNYSEVGYFNLGANGVYDSTFTAVDSAGGDCATGFMSAGGRQACSFGNTTATPFFGRFIPDHFEISAGTNIEGCDSGNFTYFGQDGLSTTFALRAENIANAVTRNYTGAYAKLGLNTWSNFNFTASPLPASSTLSASATAPTGVWLNGAANIVARHLISRPTAATTPTNITLSAKPTDSDGVTMPVTAVAASSLFRFGRLFVPNSYGSELLPLSIPIEAQYWNGNAYQRNQQDTCSVVPVNTIAMSNYRNNLAACETQLSGGGALVAGRTNVALSRPGAGNNGSVDLTVNLNGTTGSTCNSATASSAGNANMPWFGSNPNARSTFGIFKTPMIYMRENF